MIEGRAQSDPGMSSGGASISRLVLVLLAISVSINLLVAGMVVGQRLDGSRPSTRVDNVRSEANGNRPGPYDLFIKSAPEPVLPFLKEAITSHQDLSQIQLQQLREARREAAKQLKAQPFDVTAASAAFARVRSLIAEIQRGVHENAIGAYARAYGQTPPAMGSEPQPQ
ncbi:periplasmic heavy metal sensor [Azospirillum sp. B4]|uniref:periplasmic heavy metal sensor n=1 Tax=Azospirillum sp. B4 TaxID=95605 RepID=UPI00034895B6|nr:periplasmic heavy metal sensor [Azospirillum sp. B4]